MVTNLEINITSTAIGSDAPRTIVLLLAFMINLSRRQMTDVCLLQYLIRVARHAANPVGRGVTYITGRLQHALGL